MGNLQEMLDKQQGLEERLGYAFGNNVPVQDVTAYIKEMSIHATQEMHEMLYELPFFKPWKDYSKITQKECDVALDAAREEFIDMWHFVLAMGVGLGFTEDELAAMYLKKNAENHRRQDEVYTHDKSYRLDEVSRKRAEKDTLCRINMDGEVAEATEFVAILCNGNDHTIYSQTDFLTIAIARELICNAYEEYKANESEENVAEVERMIEEGDYEEH